MIVAQISRLEQNIRLPNVATVQARFLPVLRLENEPAARDRLLQLAEHAQQQRADADFEGVAEELINALTQIKKFFVVARLNVDTILEGGIQKVGDRLRVTAQLVDAGNGQQEPSSARAHTGLADCYATLGSWENGTLPPIEAMTKAQAAASKALTRQDDRGPNHIRRIERARCPRLSALL